MSNRGSAIWAGSMGLLLSYLIVGCTGGEKAQKGPEELKVTVAQGSSSGVMGPYSKGANVEGEKDGVTMTRNDQGFHVVSATKDAKVGDIELTIKEAGRKIASVIVTVTEPEIGLKFHLLGGKNVRATVRQNDETEIRTSVIRRSEYALGSHEGSIDLAVTGKFQGDLKLSAEVVTGGKGITVRFDPETVKGSEQTSQLKIKAAENADLGEVVVKLTATTSEGKTASASVSVVVDVAPKKK
jgi:hypothetical protein